MKQTEPSPVLKPDNNSIPTPHFQCLPEFGGRLNRLTLRNGKHSAQILRSFDTFDEITADTTFCNTLLFPFVNRLKDGKYTIECNEYQAPINDPSTGNALHGFLFDEQFDISESVPIDEKKRLFEKLELSHHYRQFYSWYPFDINYSVRFSFPAPHKFRIDIHIENSGDINAPVATGWHPYFDFGHPIDELQLSTPSARKILIDERMIPTGDTEQFYLFNTQNHNQKPPTLGTLQFDNCFRFDGDQAYTTRLASPRRGYAIDLIQPGNLPYFQLFTPLDRKSIAAEPMSSNINAFQNGDGLMVLPPGDSFRAYAEVQLII